MEATKQERRDIAQKRVKKGTQITQTQQHRTRSVMHQPGLLCTRKEGTSKC